MKRFVLLFFILIPSLAYAQPSIKFESEKHDFGNVTEGEELEYSFEFSNAGTEDLLIDRLVPS